MAVFDLILLIILGGFVLFGLWSGLIHMVGSIVGLVAGAWLSSHYYEQFGGWIDKILPWHGNTTKVIAFIILFILINRLVGVLFWGVEKIFNIIAIIPFLKTINRLAGAVLGLIEGMIVVGATLFVASRYNLGDWFTGNMEKSVVVPWLVSVGSIIKPLVPMALGQLKSAIPGLPDWFGL